MTELICIAAESQGLVGRYRCQLVKTHEMLVGAAWAELAGVNRVAMQIDDSMDRYLSRYQAKLAV
jgi:hypothetical protein